MVVSSRLSLLPTARLASTSKTPGRRSTSLGKFKSQLWQWTSAHYTRSWQQQQSLCKSLAYEKCQGAANRGVGFYGCLHFSLGQACVSILVCCINSEDLTIIQTSKKCRMNASHKNIIMWSWKQDQRKPHPKTAMMSSQLTNLKKTKLTFWKSLVINMQSQYQLFIITSIT